MNILINALWVVTVLVVAEALRRGLESVASAVRHGVKSLPGSSTPLGIVVDHQHRFVGVDTLNVHAIVDAQNKVLVKEAPALHVVTEEKGEWPRELTPEENARVKELETEGGEKAATDLLEGRIPRAGAKKRGRQ